MTVKKCVPQGLPHRLGFRSRICSCIKKIDPQQLFHQNVRDVASALEKILKICGIHECKAHAARDVIIDTFLAYDEIRHRIDVVPKKKIRKVDLIYDLGNKCLMSLMEAQLTYSIMKRAFKAFYYGTAEFGIRNPIMEAQLIHSQECLWVHAAKRTAQIFAEYEGMFFSAQKKYEELIKRVYICLYDTLKRRADPIQLPICSCKNGAKKTIVADKNVSVSVTAIQLIPNPCGHPIAPSMRHTSTSTCRQSKESESSEYPQGQLLENFPRCLKCKCPRLICDCDIDLTTGLLNQECSQGPFKCRWIRIYGTKPLWDPCIRRPKEHTCPIDCDQLSVLMSETEAEAVCEEDLEMDDIETDIIVEEEDYESDKKSNESEISTLGAHYTCEPAVPNTTPIMLPDKICFARDKKAFGDDDDENLRQKRFLDHLAKEARGSVFGTFREDKVDGSKNKEELGDEQTTDNLGRAKKMESKRGGKSGYGGKAGKGGKGVFGKGDKNGFGKGSKGGKGGYGKGGKGRFGKGGKTGKTGKFAKKKKGGKGSKGSKGGKAGKIGKRGKANLRRSGRKVGKLSGLQGYGRMKNGNIVSCKALCKSRKVKCENPKCQERVELFDFED